MSFFKNVCLIKSQQRLDVPYALTVSDLTEICYLAGMVKNDVDSITIPVDTYSLNPLDDFGEYLSTHPADMIGLSSMTGAYTNALQYAKIAKKHNLYVAMGGYHPTALTEEVLKSPYVDAVIRGEGEYTFKELVNEGPSEGIKGLSFKDNGNLVHNQDRDVIENLDAVPHPLREIRPKRFGSKTNDYSLDTIFTSRGCRIKCSFCSNEMVNKSWRHRSPENVIEELKMIHSTKKRKILKIWDANVLTDVDRMERIVDLMFENNLTNFKLWTESRSTDIVKAERIMKKFHDIGFRHVSLGIESPNLETLKRIGKGTNPQTCEKAIEILKDYRIRVQGYFIIGHLNETVEDIKMYPEYAKKAGIKTAVFMVMTPYPGTRIYEEFKKENAINSYNWNMYNNFGTVVEPNKIDLKTLKKMWVYCNAKFYGLDASSRHQTILCTVHETIFRLLLITVVEKNDDRNSFQDLKDYILEHLKTLVGNNKNDADLKNSRLIKILGKKFIFRFFHSKGNSIDFRFTKNGSLTNLSITNGTKVTGCKCITFYLDDILKFEEHLSTNRIVALTTRYQIAKINKTKKPLRYLMLLLDKDLQSSIYHITAFIIKTAIRSTFHNRSNY